MTTIPVSTNGGAIGGEHGKVNLNDAARTALEHGQRKTFSGGRMLSWTVGGEVAMEWPRRQHAGPFTFGEKGRPFFYKSTLAFHMLLWTLTTWKGMST